MNACRICENSQENRTHSAREMMFGLSGEFDYLECNRCGCLQLLEVPKDLSAYYPKDYYSFKRHGKLMTMVRQRWSAHAFGRKSIIGAILGEIYFENRAMVAVRNAKVSRSERILDVGCGAGNLLLDLQYLGYQNLTGADPFISSDVKHDGGLVIYKRTLAEMTGTYDLIMMHHSLEHMSNPIQILENASRLLAESGTLIIRLPIASSHAWRTYGIFWAQLDAPRHLFLHTHTSVDLMAKKAGLLIEKVDHETDDGTFWASEAYRRGTPMNHPDFPNNTFFKRLWGLPKNRRWRKEARAINASGEGDMVSYYMKKSPNQRERGQIKG